MKLANWIAVLVLLLAGGLSVHAGLPDTDVWLANFDLQGLRDIRELHR